MKSIKMVFPLIQKMLPLFLSIQNFIIESNSEKFESHRIKKRTNVLFEQIVRMENLFENLVAINQNSNIIFNSL